MLTIIIYCALVVLASLVGGWLPTYLHLTHTRTQLIMSFVGGLMMGVALLHLLPHSVVDTGSLDRSVGWMVVGLLAMFLMMRTFHFHQHDPPDTSGEHHEHHHGTPHDHVHAAASGHGSARPHQVSWFGLFLGLALHTLIDGVALAASVKVGLEEAGAFALVGAGTFLAIVLHKPLDALSITAVMTSAGWTKSWINVVNIAFALMCPLGALAFFIGVEQPALVGSALAFSAGAFLCISLADLLPEVQFHEHDRIKLTVALLLGVALAYGIGFIEPQHVHLSPEVEVPHEHGAH